MNSATQPHAAVAAHTATPRTDAAKLPFTRFWWSTDEDAVHADFARKLERENAALVEALESATAALGDCTRQFKGHNMIASFDVAKVYWLEAKAALAAAKGTPTAAQAVKRYLDSKQPFAS